MYVCMYVASFNDFEIYIFHSFDTTPNCVAVGMYFYNKICPFSVLFKVHCYIKMTKNQKIACMASALIMRIFQIHQLTLDDEWSSA